MSPAGGRALCREQHPLPSSHWLIWPLRPRQLTSALPQALALRTAALAPWCAPAAGTPGKLLSGVLGPGLCLSPSPPPFPSGLPAATSGAPKIHRCIGSLRFTLKSPSSPVPRLSPSSPGRWTQLAPRHTHTRPPFPGSHQCGPTVTPGYALTRGRGRPHSHTALHCHPHHDICTYTHSWALPPSPGH